MAQGDRGSWKGVHMMPGTVIMKWFCCYNELCCDAYDRAVNEAMYAWGVGEQEEES